MGGVVALPFGCKEPTQVTVTLKAGAGVCDTLGAAADKRTEIFVGSPRPRGADAGLGEARANVEGCPGEDLGSFTLVPSGRDGDVLVEVAMALSKGKPPAACGADAKDCILARRRVAFAKNQPLAMSIRLDLDCVGVSCDPDSTCFGGRCRPADTACSGAECDLAAGDGGTAPDASADAQADALADAGPSDAGACPMPTVAVPPRHIAASGGALFFIDGGAKKVYRMAPSGALTEIGDVGAAEDLDFLAAGGGRAMVGSPTQLWATSPLTALPAPKGTPVRGLAMLDTSALPVPFAYLIPNGFWVNGASGASASAPSLNTLTASASHFYLVNNTTIQKYAPSGLLLASLALDSPPWALAPAPEGQLYFADEGGALNVVDVQTTPTLPKVLPVGGRLVAMASAGESWAGFVEVGVTGGWGLDVVAATLAAGAWSGATKIAELRGAGPIPAKREIAVAGPCVYYLVADTLRVARGPF